MYIISSDMEVPDIDYLRNRVEDMMVAGIKTRDLKGMYESFKKAQMQSLHTLSTLYGINNPNSPKQILDYYNTKLGNEISESIRDSGTNADRADLMKVVYKLVSEEIKEVTEETISDLKLGDDLDRESFIDCLNRLVNNSIINSMYRDGKWTTDKVAMASMALQGRQDAKDILTYRKAKKFTESVKSFIDATHSDGLVHPAVSMGKTNRINYSSPALMNIPKQLLWNMLGPKEDGNMLVSVDIKQQEPWIMINLLGIERLQNMLLNRRELGLYEQVFLDIFDRLPETIERSEVKQAWNALTYGASKFGIKRICRNIDGDKVYQYFNKFKEFSSYRARAKKMAAKGVQLAHTLFGTELYADELNKNKLSRILMDLPIQGTGTDVLALLVQHFDEFSEENGLEGLIEIYYTRHDEVILEINKGYVQEVGKEYVFELLRNTFEHKIDDWEPFQVEIKELKVDDNFVLELKDEDLEVE